MSKAIIIDGFLQFDEDGNLLKWGGRPILLNGNIPSDPEVLKLLEKYRPAVVELTEKTIGTTKVYLEGWKCRAIECNLGNLISDSMIFARAKEFVGQRWTDAPIALAQSGDIRASILVGNITKFDLKSVLPYDNGLYVMNITGSLLKRILEHSVELYTGDRGEFLQMSGIRVTFNVTRPAQNRIISLETLCSDCEVPKYERYDMNRVYGVILSSFLYDGGDGFNMIKVSTLTFTIYYSFCLFVENRLLKHSFPFQFFFIIGNKGRKIELPAI